MTTKKNNKYRIRLDELELKKSKGALASLAFDFENHDDIFEIIDLIKTKKIVESEEQNVEFAIGLKLFSEVLIKNKNEEIFADFLPAFKEFMKKLKEK